MGYLALTLTVGLTHLSVSEYLICPPALPLFKSEGKSKENPEEEEMGKTSLKQRRQ